MIKLLNKITTRTSAGILSKAVYLINNKKYLVKGNTPFNYEPYSEVMGSIIAENLNIPTIKYFLLEKTHFPEIKCTTPHVSVCEIFDFEMSKYFTHFYNALITQYDREYLREYIPTIEFYTKANLSVSLLLKMLLLDAFIGNIDRHFNNFDVYLDNEGILKNAPVLDYGLSLLSFKPDESLEMKYEKDYIGVDDCATFSYIHWDEIRLLEHIFGDIAVLEVDNPETFLERIFDRFEKEVFPHLSDKRAKAIKKYLIARYPVYIEPYIKKEQKEIINWE